jgi:endonuclease G
MKFFNNIFKVTAVVMTVCALMLSSCDTVETHQMSVSAKSDLLSAKTNIYTFISVKCEGEWSLSLKFEDEEEQWARLDVSSGTGNKNSIRLTADPNASQARRSVKVILSSRGTQDMCIVAQKAADEEIEDNGQQGGSGETEGIVGNTPLERTGWMELPAMDNPNLGYYSHSFKMNGKSYRNYSFGWSQKDLVAIWVAYPLCRFYTSGSVGRTEAWAYDPLLKQDSAAPFGGYGEELARGHQIPSADRQCCYEANAQTFYGTNMTPQLNAHNEKIWASLEGKVRGYANTSDTTYVVTGVILDDSTRITYDSDQKPITVPSAYFKAILKYNESSTLGSWNAAAFYLEHRAYSEGLGKQHSMSIDRLEDITGIDFFVNLPAKIGKEQADRLEAADPAGNPMWW